jgi:hypothetical protein
MAVDVASTPLSKREFRLPSGKAIAARLAQAKKLFSERSASVGGSSIDAMADDQNGSSRTLSRAAPRSYLSSRSACVLGRSHGCSRDVRGTILMSYYTISLSWGVPATLPLWG